MHIKKVDCAKKARKFRFVILFEKGLPVVSEVGELEDELVVDSVEVLDLLNEGFHFEFEGFVLFDLDFEFGHDVG